MLKVILKGSFLVFCIMIIILSFFVGFYFGYDTAGDYCHDVIKDCVVKLKASSSIANAFLDEGYEVQLREQFESLRNSTLNFSGIIK
jgi:hypothetical protein